MFKTYVKAANTLVHAVSAAVDVVLPPTRNACHLLPTVACLASYSLWLVKW